MEQFYDETFSKLETAIAEMEIEAGYSIKQIEAIISLIVECMSNVREYILLKGFKSTDEEIRFFKYKKPLILSKLIYYNAIYKIET